MPKQQNRQRALTQKEGSDEKHFPAEALAKILNDWSLYAFNYFGNRTQNTHHICQQIRATIKQVNINKNLML